MRLILLNRFRPGDFEEKKSVPALVLSKEHLKVCGTKWTSRKGLQLSSHEASKFQKLTKCPKKFVPLPRPAQNHGKMAKSVSLSKSPSMCIPQLRSGVSIPSNFIYPTKFLENKQVKYGPPDCRSLLPPKSTPTKNVTYKRVLDLKPVVFKEPKGSSPVCSSSSMIGSNSASRYDSSLLKLTKNFLHLVQYCPEGVINLNEAAESLGVQKRRLYDITNVLEGIDLVEKMGKNSIRWKVTPQQASTYGVTARSLEEENEALDKKEKHLDDMIGQLQNAIKLATEDPTEQPYAYVKYDDLRSVPGFSDHTVFAIKAPADSCLEVPDPRETGKLQMLIKSQNGQQVEVFLCPENSPTAHSALSLPSSSSNATVQSNTPSHLYTSIDAQASCSSENVHMSGEFANLHTTADGSTYLLEDGLAGDCKPWHQPPPHSVALGQSEAILMSTSQADKSLFFGSLELPDSPLKPLLLSEAQLKTPVNHPSSHLQPLATATSAFVQLQPPQEENYQFALDYAEGLSDLFLDSYNSSLSDQSGGSLSNSVTMSY